MAELKDVLARLQAEEKITSVALGRRLRGSALAPAFQIFLSTQMENGYKLLARAGPEVQEVLVQSTLSREDMKEAVRNALVIDGDS
eukprot:jgi/Mesen1/10781/ME000091S10302